MKFQKLYLVLTSAFLLLITGCSSPHPQQAGKQTASADDQVEVVSIAVQPTKLSASKPWKIIMRVRNVSSQLLENVRYEFQLSERGADRFGIGKIPRISPGETVQVISESAPLLRPGGHRLEGRVFPEKNESRANRMNNLKSIQFEMEP